MSIILPYYLHDDDDDDDDDTESPQTDDYIDPHNELLKVKTKITKKTPGILDVHEKTNISPTYIGVDQEIVGNCGMWASSNILLNFINYSIFYYNKYNRKIKQYLKLPLDIIDKVQLIFTSRFILGIIDNEMNLNNGYKYLDDTLCDLRYIKEIKKKDVKTYHIIIHIFIIYFFCIVVLDDIVRIKERNSPFNLYNREKYKSEVSYREELSDTRDLAPLPNFHDRGANMVDYLHFFNKLYIEHKLPSQLIDDVKGSFLIKEKTLI